MWNNNNYGRTSYNGSNYRDNNRSYKKKSGCRVTMKDTNVPIVSAWKKSKKGFVTLYARPYKNSQIRKFDDGKEYINLFVTITNKDTMQVTKTSGLFHFDTKKLYLPEFNLVANPRGGRGGYFGIRFTKEFHK